VLWLPFSVLQNVSFEGAPAAQMMSELVPAGGARAQPGRGRGAHREREAARADVPGAAVRKVVAGAEVGDRGAESVQSST